MKTIKKHSLLFILSLFILLCISFFIAINTGTIKVSFIQLLKGLFVEYNKDVASIYQIRFPRVIVTMLVGCALALAGLLFQVVLKNPLADPGIIGISAGAQLVSLLVGIFLPEFYTVKPLLTCLGGFLTFVLIYSLSWKSGLKTTRIILVGVAIHSQPRPTDLKMFFWRELSFIGARVYEYEDYEVAIELVNKKELPLEKLITNVMPLGKIQNLFEEIVSNPSGMKFLVDCQA